jgi:aarF domain-containing kinase
MWRHPKHELIRLSGRASMVDEPDDQPQEKDCRSTFKRASSMLEQLPQTEQEVEALRNAVMTKEGLLISVFDILRNVPRRVLMVFKLNDLTRYYYLSLWHAITLTNLPNRSLDYALSTTHSKVSYYSTTGRAAGLFTYDT